MRSRHAGRVLAHRTAQRATRRSSLRTRSSATGDGSRRQSSISCCFFLMKGEKAGASGFTRPSLPQSAIRLKGTVSIRSCRCSVRAKVLLETLQSALDDRRIRVAKPRLDAIGDKRPEHREADIGQGEIHRPQEKFDVTAAAVERIGFHARADRQREHRPLAREPSVLEPLVARVDLPVDEDPVEPPLQDRRRKVPPHRVLRDQQIRPVEAIDFGRDDGRQGALGGGVTLLGLDVEPGAVQRRRIVRRALAGIEAHLVEIGERRRPSLSGLPRLYRCSRSRNPRSACSRSAIRVS